MLRNSWLKWFENRMNYRRLCGRTGTRRGRTAGQNRPAVVRVSECLETRTLLTTYLVDTTDDVVDAGDGLTSLREAIELAEANTGADEIRFAAGLEGEVFNVTLGALPTITESLGIFGTIGDAQTINGAGLIVNASGAGNVTTFAVNSVNINLEPTGAGLSIEAVDDGVADVTIFNSQISNSATQGVKFVAHTGGVVNLTLGVVGVFSNGDVAPSEGILGEIGVDPAGAESLTTPGNFATANLDFATLRVGNQFLEGFELQVEDGGQVTTPAPIRDSAFNDNGAGNQRSGLKFSATDSGSSISASFENVAINNATGHAFEFSASNGADLDTTIIGGTAFSADADALHYEYDDATGEHTIDGFDGTQAGDNGAEILLFGGSVVSFNQLDNATFNNAVNSGLQVGVLPGSTLAAFNSTGLTASNNGGSGALLTTLSSVSTFVFTDLTTNNNLIRGIQIGENMGGVSTKTFNNVTATGNKLAQAMGIGVGNGAVLDLNVNGGALTTTGAVIGANAVYAPIRGASTANLSFAGLSMDNSTSSGIVVDYDQASLGNFNVSNTTSTGNQAVGVALFVRGGSNVTGGFDNVDVSSAGQLGPANGIRVDVIGTGANADLTFNNVTANGASGVGVGLLYNAGATGSVNQFDNINALSTGGDGVNVHVRGVNTLLSAFNANTVNASGAGLGTTQSADGLDLSVVGPGAMGTFNLLNVNADGAGGRGVKLQTENTATLDVTMDGFSADGNGLEGVAVDVGTVAAGSQLTGTFTGGTASNNGTAFMIDSSGIRTTVTGAGSAADVGFDAASANANTLDGFSLIADNGADLTADLRNGVAGLGNAQHGVNFDADGAATTASLLSSVAGNNYTGNGGNGANVLLTNAVTADEITIKGSAVTNQGDGVNIKSDDATGVTINALQVTGNNPMLNNNFGNGLVIDLDSVGGLASLDLSSLTVNDNADDQVNVSLANMMLEDVSFTDISADGPGAGVGNGDGVELTLDNTSVNNSLGLSGITAAENGEDGLQLNFLNGATIPTGSAIDLGTFNNNGQHGVNITVNSSAVALDLTNSMHDMGSIASLSNNGGNGLDIRLDDASLTMGAIDHQTIENNGGSGVEIQAATPSTFISNNSFTNNTVADNGGFGFRGIFNAGLFDVSIGSTTTPDSGNVFLNNVGSAIAIDMIQKTLGQLRIVDNVIAGTNNGPGTFNGEGIFIRQLGTVNPAQATSSLQNLSDPPGSPGLLIQGNQIGVDAADMADGNASFGVTFQVEEESSINGLHILDNQISNNGSGGINFARRDNVAVTDFIIGANMIQDNSGNGVSISANNSAAAGLLEVTIGQDLDGDAHLRTDVVNWLDTLDGNVISGNTNGIHLDVVTDSQLHVDLNENMIRANGRGVFLTETALSGDTRRLFGNWDQNIISNNAGRGVLGNARSFITITDGIVGAVLDQFSQVIPGLDGNGNTGLEINSTGDYTIGLPGDVNSGLDIIRNGRSVQGDRTVGHGIDIQFSNKDVNVYNSLIIDNFQDGVEINTANTATMNVVLEDNRIVSNVGRGIDALSQFTSTLWLTVQGTNDPRANPIAALAQVSSNGEEGIYLVNTPDGAQDQSSFSYVPLLQGANVNPDSHLNATVNNVAINFNGNDVGQESNDLRPAGSGLVVRVGTSNSRQIVGFDGRFATFGPGPTPSGLDLFPGGAVAMSVFQNYVEGNVGDGMFFHGYRATTPSDTGATWTDTQIQQNGYQTDPLARLDMRWGVQADNTHNVFAGGDDLNVNNTGRRGTPDGEAGAFYDDADAEFKSRTNNKQGTNPDGPFTSGTRRRNAQRLGLRVYGNGTALAPTGGAGLNPAFLYPGMGDSTFRVSSLSGDNADLPTSGGLSGFNLDSNSPLFNPGDANGTGFTFPIFGEIPFGWGTF